MGKNASAFNKLQMRSDMAVHGNILDAEIQLASLSGARCCMVKLSTTAHAKIIDVFIPPDLYNKYKHKKMIIPGKGIEVIGLYQGTLIYYGESLPTIIAEAITITRSKPAEPEVK